MKKEKQGNEGEKEGREGVEERTHTSDRKVREPFQEVTF